MRSVVICVLAALITAQGLLAQDIRTAPRQEERSGRKWWWVSVAALTAATLLDVQTSVGKYELNPLFRSRDGRFDARRGVAIKMGVVGGSAAAQFFLFRKRMPAAVTVANYAAAGVLGGVALRNSRIDKAPPRADAPPASNR